MVGDWGPGDARDSVCGCILHLSICGQPRSIVRCQNTRELAPARLQGGLWEQRAVGRGHVKAHHCLGCALPGPPAHRSSCPEAALIPLWCAAVAAVGASKAAPGRGVVALRARRGSLFVALWESLVWWWSVRHSGPFASQDSLIPTKKRRAESSSKASRERQPLPNNKRERSALPMASTDGWRSRAGHRARSRLQLT